MSTCTHFIQPSQKLSSLSGIHTQLASNSPTFLFFLTTSLLIIIAEVQLLSVIHFTLST